MNKRNRNTAVNRTQRNFTISKKAVKSMIMANQASLEKYIDTYVIWPSTSVNSTTIALLNMPTTGTGETNMNGTSINIKRLDYRQTLHIYNAIQPNNDVFLCRLSTCQAIGSYMPTYGDVYQNSANPLDIINSPFRYDTEGLNFHVLDDVKYCVDSFNLTKVYNTRIIPSKIHNSRYDAVNSDWSNGQLFYCLTVYSPSGSQDLGFNFSYRTWFFDI